MWILPGTCLLGGGGWGWRWGKKQHPPSVINLILHFTTLFSFPGTRNALHSHECVLQSLLTLAERRGVAEQSIPLGGSPEKLSLTRELLKNSDGTLASRIIL